MVLQWLWERAGSSPARPGVRIFYLPQAEIGDNLNEEILAMDG